MNLYPTHRQDKVTILAQFGDFIAQMLQGPEGSFLNKGKARRHVRLHQGGCKMVADKVTGTQH